NLENAGFFPVLAADDSGRPKVCPIDGLMATDHDPRGHGPARFGDGMSGSPHGAGSEWGRGRGDHDLPSAPPTDRDLRGGPCPPDEKGIRTETTNVPGAGPSWVPLNPRERRVLGVMVEKAKTTPEYYPMTVAAIVTACNQKSNRDPVTNYDPDDVE